MGSRFGLDGAEDGSADDGADEADECRPGSKKMPSHRKMAGQRKVKLLLHDHGDRGVVDDAVGEVQVNRESALRAYISARLRLSFLFVGMMSLHSVLPILLYRGHVFLLVEISVRGFNPTRPLFRSSKLTIYSSSGSR
jgi:hypothetical protein